MLEYYDGSWYQYQLIIKIFGFSPTRSDEFKSRSGIQKPAQFLRDKWRNSKNWGSNRNSSIIDEGKGDSVDSCPADQPAQSAADQTSVNAANLLNVGPQNEGGRLSRLFSIRKSIVHGN